MELLSPSKSPADFSPAPDLMISRIPKPLQELRFIGACYEPGCTTIRAGKFQGSAAGIGKVTFSDVTAAESGRGCGLGRGGNRTGNKDVSSQGTLRIKRNSTEQIFLFNNLTLHNSLSGFLLLKESIRENGAQKLRERYILHGYTQTSCVTII
jgi:hypothetical protein